MNKYLKYFLLMIIVGFIVSSLLAITNEVTYPIIENNKIEKIKTTLEKVDNSNKWTTGSDNINIGDDEYIEDVFISVDENDNIIMIAYLLTTKGYSNGNIELIVFINNTKKIINSVEIINIENQTKGVGSLIVDDENYVKVFNNQNVNKYINDNINNHNSESVDIISGATISSRAVVQGVITACNNFNDYKGGIK